MAKAAPNRRRGVGLPPAPVVSPEDQALIIDELIPREHRNAVLHVLAETIEFAHRAHPERWGVRILDSGFMLSVGPHEVLQVHVSTPDLQFVVRGISVPAEVRDDDELWFSGDQDYFGAQNAGAVYPSNPGSEKVLVPFALVQRIYPKLRPAHEQVIEYASQKGRNPQTRRMHMPDFVNFVAAEVGRRLPQPAYFDARP